MYFPYFRGRQYELLALKALVSSHLLSEHVIPVVEPVKLLTRKEKFIVPYKMIPTFDVTIQSFVDAKRRIAIIGNPDAGDVKRIDDANGLIDSYLQSNEIIPSVIINQSAPNRISEFCKSGINKNDILVVFENQDYLPMYLEQFESISPLYTLFTSDERDIRRSVRQNRVMFKECFKKKAKNADYATNCDEHFSDDHIYFKEEGFVGFGDYSIVGSAFDEGGWAARAVAIHIVYFAHNDKLRIHHFVSDSNIDTKDAAGKYYEAVAKLVEWVYNGHQDQITTALSEFINHYENGYYPGLPTIKKLSIMHHLELMSRYLDGGLAK